MDKTRWNLWLRGAAGCALITSAACADVAEGGVGSSTPALTEEAYAAAAWAELRDASGRVVGRATFADDGDATLVTVTAQLAAEQAGIHGMHVHANDVADNGNGCLADPNAAASTHFVSADGHFNPHGAGHGHHQGDMPALFFSTSGEAFMQFRTDRFAPDELRGRALIVHAGADNYGNVPVGDAADQYTPNSDAASELTAKTGNAGARLACGIIE